MATAALRHAATTMLQRSSPAAAGQQLRLLPRRLVHGGGGSPSGFSAAAAERPTSLMDLHWRKQELAEELYDVLAEIEKGILGKYFKPRGVVFSTKNSELLGAVTEHVEARPHDPDWRWFRGKQRYDSRLAWMTSVGFFYCVWFHDFHEIGDWLASRKTSLPSQEERACFEEKGE